MRNSRKKSILLGCVRFFPRATDIQRNGNIQTPSLLPGMNQMNLISMPKNGIAGLVWKTFLDAKNKNIKKKSRQ